MTYDVLVYGPLFCDLIFTDLPSMPVLGTEVFAKQFTVAIGGSAIVAAALHRLGVKVGLIAELGSDPMSHMARELLDDMGLDRRLIREHPHPLPQISVALSFPHDRAFVTRFERPNTPPDLGRVLRENPARHLHVYGFLAAEETPDAAGIAHRAGMTVSMDPGWDEQVLRSPLLKAMIAELDVFLPSRSELCWIAEDDDPDRAMATVFASMRGGQLVMKDGARGAVAFSPDGIERVPALPVTPVDTTGAGDAFDAGFLFAYTQQQSVKDCLRYGAVCGALATIAPGGATAVPNLQEVQSWLSK